MSERTPATTILRDDLLAQLRTARAPMTTTELRIRAPKVPVAGLAHLAAPLREQVYTVLRALERDGVVVRSGTADAGTVSWTALPSPADHEIAALETALATHAPPPPVVSSVAAEHLKAAARTARRRATHAGDQTPSINLSRIVDYWADVLLVGGTHPQPRTP